MQALKLSELIGALSYALDITEGQPEGHCVRCCWIGMHIGHQLALPTGQLWELYYTLLLKDLGCSPPPTSLTPSPPSGRTVAPCRWKKHWPSWRRRWARRLMPTASRI